MGVGSVSCSNAPGSRDLGRGFFVERDVESSDLRLGGSSMGDKPLAHEGRHGHSECSDLLDAPEIWAQLPPCPPWPELT